MSRSYQQSSKFVNTSKNDFHLMSTDTGARGFGVNLTNDANLPFNTDIDGQMRPASTSAARWDIGADQKLQPMRISN